MFALPILLGHGLNWQEEVWFRLVCLSFLMNIDFTIKKYTKLLQALKDYSFRFLTFEYYCAHKSELEKDHFVILRHDVDLKAENSLETAKIECSLDIPASYYFRVVEQSNKPSIIKEIAGMGHEIGYHYEDMALCRGDRVKAIEHFEKQLDYFRQFYPVKTICMHGAPQSKYDGKDLWKSYDYHDFGIVGEPYFDVDFSKVFYLTDTGRRWDGFHVSVRDRIPGFQEQWEREGLVYHSTDDILRALSNGEFPQQVMITTHPQRWSDNKTEWLMEGVKQNVKNEVKRMLLRRG